LNFLRKRRMLNHNHQAQLVASGLTQSIIDARGYTTFTDARSLRDLGFSEAQAQRIPALGIPCWNQRGEAYGWQIRPDCPRTDLAGKVQAKYERPRGDKAYLDVHPSQTLALGNPQQRLWITEGVKKGDSLAAQGECCIALQGVWGWRGSNKDGGKTALAGWNDIALNDRHIYLVFDNDVTRNPRVRGALEALYNYLSGRQARPHVVLLPDDGQKIGIDDFLAQGHTIAEVLAYADQPLPKPENSPQLKPGVPLLTLHTHELPSLVEQALEALCAMPQAPRVFQRARRLCIISPAEPQAVGLARPTGAPIIQALTAPCLRHLLAQAANWQTPNQAGTKVYPDKPASWLVETLLDMDAWPGIPPLTGLLGAPTLRPDGTLLTAPGYDTHTGLFLHFHTAFPAIPDAPSHDDAVAALQVLCEPFVDFPFEAPWHRSAALAAILSLLARYAVDSVPLFAIRATTRGSGKTLLADAIALIATSRVAAKLPQAKEEEEEKKRLLAIAMDGDPLVLIDNVSGDLGSPALDLALTSRVYKDRLLGKNQTKEAPMYTVFMATGNHMSFRGDLARRVVPIDLLPDTENPEERTGFAHPHLLSYIERQRAHLVVAGLTLLRAYCVAGRPTQPFAPYGSFEAWGDLIRSALTWAEMADPCLGRRGLEASSDEAYDVLGELLESWHACYQGAPTTLKTVFRHLEMFQDDPRYQRLHDAIGGLCESRGKDKKISARLVGHALKKVEKRIINHKRFEKHGDKGEEGISWTVKSL
jgi:hypothetical protein